MNKYYIDSGEKQFQQSQKEVLETLNRSGESLKNSAVSFACDREHKYEIEDYRVQLDEQLAENIELKRMLMEEIEKNKRHSNLDSSQVLLEQQDKFAQILNKKDNDILNLTKLLRQLEIEVIYQISQNKLLHKGDQLESSRRQDKDKQFEKKIFEYEQKINLVLGENEKLNQVKIHLKKILQDRITQIEKMKQTVDQVEKEKLQLAEKYEIMLQETSTLSAREKQTIEKSSQQLLNSHKIEFQKQLSLLNTQNTQLSSILGQQKGQIEQLEQQLEEHQMQMDDLRKQSEVVVQEKDKQILSKEKENQELLLKFNELEKKLVNQNHQISQLEQQLSQSNEQTMIDEMQKYYEDQIDKKEAEMKKKHQVEINSLMVQLNENQCFIEELQNHLTEIHKQITKFKQEKQNLKQQNSDLQQQVSYLEHELKQLEEKTQHDYLLPSFNISCQSAITDQSIEQGNLQLRKSINKSKDLKQNKENQEKKDIKLQCINQIKQQCQQQGNSYKAQFQQKVKKVNPPNKEVYALDSFGNRDRSISCLDMINKGIKFRESSDEDEEVSPIAQFKQWKQQMTVRQ